MSFAISFADVQAAESRFRKHLPPSPLIPLDVVSAQVKRDVWCKLDAVYPTGAFKVRGALNVIEAQLSEARERGVITFSTGNHGAAVAWAGRRLGVDVTVYVSELIQPNKLEALERYEANVVIHGPDQDTAEAAAEEEIKRSGAVFASPISDPLIMAGQGIIGSEIISQLPDVGTIVVPVSGGGMCSGILTAVHHLKPQTKVIGVSMERGAAMYESLKAGKPVKVTEVVSLADSLGGGIGGPESPTFPIIQAMIDDLRVVSEDDIADALVFLLMKERLLLEGAAATALACLMRGPIEDFPGPIVLLGCGRNIDPAVVVELAQAAGSRDG